MHHKNKAHPIPIWQKLLACIVIAAALDVSLINLVLYPDCNRTTRDCFLVANAWGHNE